MKTTNESAIHGSPSRHVNWLVVGLVAAALAVAIVMLADPSNAMAQETDAELKDEGFGGLQGVLEELKGKLEPILVALSGIGLVAGGAFLAVGQQIGVRIMVMAGIAGGGVLAGTALTSLWPF
jgi:hypothetical protein